MHNIDVLAGILVYGFLLFDFIRGFDGFTPCPGWIAALFFMCSSLK